MKPARGTAIRFLGSAIARPLESDRLCSALLQSALHRLFTRTERCLVRVIEFNMSMFWFVLLVQFSILFEIAVALLFIFCLKLKSGIFKRIFPTQLMARKNDEHTLYEMCLKIDDIYTRSSPMIVTKLLRIIFLSSSCLRTWPSACNLCGK